MTFIGPAGRVLSAMYPPASAANPRSSAMCVDHAGLKGPRGRSDDLGTMRPFPSRLLLAAALLAAFGCARQAPVQPAFGLARADEGPPEPLALLDTPSKLPPAGRAPFPAATAGPAAAGHQTPYFWAPAPAGWRLATAEDPPAAFALVADRASGRLTVAEREAGGTTLPALLAELTAQAGEGLVAAGPVRVDDVAGMRAMSNQQPAEGPRAVRTYGFVYRKKAFVLTASWAKLDPAAKAIGQEVDQIILGWRWL